MKNILSNWDEFVAYFSSVFVACDSKHKHKMRQLVNILIEIPKTGFILSLLRLLSINLKSQMSCSNKQKVIPQNSFPNLH